MTTTEIGERIREKRKERKLSQQELAELASLNYVTISKYESGKVEPGAKAIARIANALEITADELLGLEADKKDPVIADGDTHEMLAQFAMLSPAEKQRVLAYAEGILSSHAP